MLSTNKKTERVTRVRLKGVFTKPWRVLLIATALFGLLFADLAGSMARLAFAGAPVDAYAAKMSAFLHHRALPIIFDRAYLGVDTRRHPEVHSTYRVRREELLARITASDPSRRVIALILLDRLYAPEDMAVIIDPLEVNIVGVSSFLPCLELGPQHGITNSGGLMRKSIDRRDIPTGIPDRLLLTDWSELRLHWERSADMERYDIRRHRAELAALRAGEIPAGNPIGITDGAQAFSTQDPEIMALSAAERLRHDGFRRIIASKETSLMNAEDHYRRYGSRRQKSMGIYAVTVEGPAGKVNALRQRAGIDLVDPMLFPGFLGAINSGERNAGLRIMFLPGRPAPHHSLR